MRAIREVKGEESPAKRKTCIKIEPSLREKFLEGNRSPVQNVSLERKIKGALCRVCGLLRRFLFTGMEGVLTTCGIHTEFSWSTPNKTSFYSPQNNYF